MEKCTELQRRVLPDEQIVQLYWDRDENAIKETDKESNKLPPETDKESDTPPPESEMETSIEHEYRYNTFEENLKFATDLIEGVFVRATTKNQMYYYEFTVTRHIRGEKTNETIAVGSSPNSYGITNFPLRSYPDKRQLYCCS